MVQTEQIRIPTGLSLNRLIRTLEIGHGYRWLTITKTPRLVVYGRSQSQDLPEILAMDPNILVLDGGDPNSVNRLRRLMTLLTRQSAQVATGGVP